MSCSTLTTTNFTNSSDANFRAWGLAIHNAIIAGGWVDNGDSGQINFASVLAPAAINTSQGYKVYRSNDAGGGLDQFYIKLEFGSGAVSLTRPALWITAGFQGSDGAGNLLSTINPISTRTQIAVGANPAGASVNINMAAGSGYISICSTSTLANEHLVVSVERTRNASLASMNQINLFGSAGGVFDNTGGYGQTINKTTAFPAVSTVAQNQNAIIPANADTPIGGVVALGLVFGFAPSATSPSMNIFGVEDTALGVYQDVITIPILGVNHDYKLQRVLPFVGLGSTVLLTRWE